MEDLLNKCNPTPHDDKDVPAEVLTKCSDVEVTLKASDTVHADVMDHGKTKTCNQQEPGLGATQRNLSQEEMMRHMVDMMKTEIKKETEQKWDEKWNKVGNENTHQC
jgi:hypothetical protein